MANKFKMGIKSYIILLFIMSEAESTFLGGITDFVENTVHDIFGPVKNGKVQSGDTTDELIRADKFTAEVHTVQTQDGYILTMHRIPKKDSPYPPVFLQHGLESTSADWVMMGPEISLGYLLAKQGFDVWMGNFRGNTYSRNHTSLNPASTSFWDFSWHELGIYDLPAMIDYVLDHTNKPKLFHIGHSQGTTTFYVMTSMKPEYNEKIVAHFSLSPVVYMDHASNPIMKHFANLFSLGGEIAFKLLGVGELLPNPAILKTLRAMLSEAICGKNKITQLVCSNLMFLICGFDENELDESRLSLIGTHTPAGASIKQFIHYTQEVNSGRFCSYQNIYGDCDDYPLDKVTAKVFLHYGVNDWLSSPVDVKRLQKELRNSTMVKVNHPLWCHSDFVYAKHVHIVLNKPIIKTILKLVE